MAYLPDLSFGADTRIVLVGTTRCPKDEAMLPPVPHAEHNIAYLSRLFTDPSICGLDPGCIVRVLDREHASEITSEIARAAKEATDTLLVYYVGHGLYGNTETPIFLAAGNTTDTLKAFTGVSINLVREAIRSSRARKRILILDCCYSGRALDGGLSVAGPEAALAPALDLDGTFAIAAVPANAKALAPPDEKLTRFTGVLVDVLENGIDIEDRVLTLDDVFSEVERKIRRAGDAPLPKHCNWDQGEKFVIARNRFLHRRELDELYKAIEDLRATMAATGARLEAVEAKGTDLGDLPDRVAALEESVVRPISKISSKTNLLLRQLEMTEEEWNLLPAQPYKLHVRRALKARKLTLSLMLILFFAATGLMPPMYMPNFYLGGFLLCVLSLSLVATMLVKKSEPPVTYPLPSEDVLLLLSSNEHLAEIMERTLVNVWGVYLDQNLAIGAACIGSVAPLLTLVWKTLL